MSAIDQLPPKKLRWQRLKKSSLARQREVFTTAFIFIFQLWWDRFWQDNTSRTRNHRADWLVRNLLELGPTFIKIGQSLSTRVDLLPSEYISNLSQLQDKVPAFSGKEAREIIEVELGKSIYTIYRDFDEIPLAAASLGQVHRATLHTGEEVVVKVQRPGLKGLFDLDLQAVGKLLKFSDRFLTWTRKYNLQGIYQEFFTVLYQEIDYAIEGGNADRFRKNFQGYPRIIVPKVYWEYSTSMVLTLEYVPGIKVDDRQALEACGLDPKEINQLGICCYLKQLLQDGFFHADPHPGNLAVSPTGSLIFYDYGMMAEVKTMAKDQMVKTFFAVLRKDTNEVVDSLMNMGFIEPIADMSPVKRMLKFVLDRFTERPVNIYEFEQIKGEVVAIFEKQPFRLPPQMTYLLKSLTTLDGIARILDPDYNFTTAAQPFVKSIVLTKGRGNTLGAIAQQAKDFLVYQLNKPSHMEILLERLEERIERGELMIQVKSSESDRTLKRINIAVKALIYACLTGFLFLTGAVIMIGATAYANWAIAIFICAALTGLSLVRSLIQLSIREKIDNIAET
ncbi:AarF/ABC1/UbiB kinase family protein [Pseudanabaena sp. FACHB-1277]|uniref:AarF/ABC1/UbiB kinase family protein n=1 Tax=Pseudanabaena cinerea FACHB-1277 TaxID=2949581 RepID=A0A926UTW5_9CYAN|nr:AarF/ABC1/UbiB kinase family protein [Pseudanabaena cinerea]MBD2149950.1 AarF/ABC1/UbiB kinase family protein [Pseudanabaena cinerea FACHB-1277]